MNKYLKYAIYALIAGMLIIIIVQYFKIKGKDKTIDLQSVELLIANDSAKIYKTKAGQVYSQLNSVVIESNVLKKSLELTGLTIKELRQKDIKWRNITATLQAELEASGHGNTILHDTVYIDSAGVKIPAKDFQWTNTYLTLAGLIKEKKVDLNYSYKVKLNSITETKGNQTKITIYTDDPNAKITSGYQISVINKTPFYKKWYIWASAGLVGGYFIAK